MPSKNHSDELEQDVRDPTEMARILCCSEMELRRLTTAGVLTRTLRKRHGRQRVCYEWESNVMRYIQHLSHPSQQSRSDYVDEKRLTQSIVRQQKELELAIARGDMIKRARVVAIMTQLMSLMKNHMLAMPARLTRQLLMQRDPNKIRAILDTGVRNCLIEANKFGAHSFDETSKNGATSNDNEAIKRVKKRVKRRRAKS